MKKLALITVFALATTTVLLVACGGSSNTTSNNPNTVRTVATTFAPTSISIKKGNTLTFLDDPNNPAVHFLIIGRNGQEQSANGTPDFGGLSGHRIEGGDLWTTSPWNIDGIYHVTCIVHPMMNLTITVTS